MPGEHRLAVQEAADAIGGKLLRHHIDVNNRRAWAWLRVRVEAIDDALQVKARAWRDGEAEPDWWHYDVADIEPASVGANGWVGITGQRLDGIREYDVFSVGTDGDSAPMPSR